MVACDEVSLLIETTSSGDLFNLPLDKWYFPPKITRLLALSNWFDLNYRRLDFWIHCDLTSATMLASICRCPFRGRSHLVKEERRTYSGSYVHCV